MITLHDLKKIQKSLSTYMHLQEQQHRCEKSKVTKVHFDDSKKNTKQTINKSIFQILNCVQTVSYMYI